MCSLIFHEIDSSHSHCAASCIQCLSLAHSLSPMPQCHDLEPRKDECCQGTGHLPLPPAPHGTPAPLLDFLPHVPSLKCLLTQTGALILSGTLFSQGRMNPGWPLLSILGPASSRWPDPSSSFVWTPGFPLICKAARDPSLPLGTVRPAHRLSSSPPLPLSPFLSPSLHFRLSV